MGPPDTWDRMAGWLRSVLPSLSTPPSALLVVSAHWEAPVATVTTNPSPPLFYDYYGFPAPTYELTWPAAGSPKLAERVRALLADARIESRGDASRGSLFELGSTLRGTSPSVARWLRFARRTC